MSIDSLVRDNIRRLTPYSSARSEFKGQADIWLDANENPFGNGLNRYPDPLQQAVKKEISRLKGVPAQNIALGNGSDEAIDLLIRIFCEPRKDRIIVLPPTYGMYRVSADIADVGVEEVPLRAGFQPDVSAILSAADERTKILFLCSPNNPTGNSMQAECIQQLLDDFPGIIAIDEAYIDFAAQSSWLPKLQEHPRLVVMQTFSKAWGLAGIRLGMLFASEAIIHYYNSVKPPYNVNELTQRAALAALQDTETYEQRLKTLLAQRTVLQQFLAGMEMVEHIYPSDANFLLVKVNNATDLYRYLVGQGIIVRDRSRAYGCAGCLRLTVGTPEENEQLFRAMLSYAVQ